VIAVARRESEELREAIGAIVERGTGGLHFRAFDLSETDAIPAFVKGVRDEFGAIYGLVNNAGIGTEGLLATMHNSEDMLMIRPAPSAIMCRTTYLVSGREAREANSPRSRCCAWSRADPSCRCRHC